MLDRHMSKDQWISEYESLGDRYDEDCERLGPAEALVNLRKGLRRLGIDEDELDEHVSGITGDI